MKKYGHMDTTGVLDIFQLEEGTGNDVAEYGSYVKLAYQTTDIKGEVVDSNDNFVTKLGMSGLAWDEVAMKMNIGERVKVVADK